MDLDEALARVWREAGRSSQLRIAQQIGVPRGALTRWKAGGIPQGELREKLIAWAESLPTPAAVKPAHEALASAVQQTDANLVRLAEIRGYAKSVLRMLRAVAEEQQMVVDSLEPYVAEEGRYLAAKIPISGLDDVRESVKHSEKKTTTTRRKTGQ